MTLLLSALIVSAGSDIDAWWAACPDPVARFTAPFAGREARAMGPGTVVRSEGDVVEVMHCYYENGVVVRSKARVSKLDERAVSLGEVVRAGQRLGRGRKLIAAFDELEIRAAPSRRTLVPRGEAVLLVVDVDAHVAERYERGVRTHQWNVARGQADGPKEVQGDLKTPRGQYSVVQKSTGPFGGTYGEYYGGIWLKLNYPNPWDAARGLDAGIISTQTARDIELKWQQRQETPQRTKLGGGIGFHAWIEPWDGPDGGYGRSWGCIVMHPEDAKSFYELVPVGTTVVLL